jgi:hypothetical protein
MTNVVLAPGSPETIRFHDIIQPNDLSIPENEMSGLWIVSLVISLARGRVGAASWDRELKFSTSPLGAISLSESASISLYSAVLLGLRGPSHPEGRGMQL